MKATRAVWVCGAFAALAAVPEALAQDPFRQTVVVTAAATPIELGHATRTLAVITREQIASLPVSSIADVLRLLSSVDVRARGDRGVQTDFAIRGANFGQMLVLVDGVRLNDAQSGHHNGDIPVPLDAVERIEVLHGPGSSLFGADAFGGTVNVITRRRAEPSAVLKGGSFGFASARGEAGFERGALREIAAVSIDRSSGFIYDREFDTVIAHSRTSFGTQAGLSVSFLRKAFGANNFYGGNAPSREWTNQTLVAADRRFGDAAAWAFSVNGSYRTHGDRFVFNRERPELSDNRHRTHTILGSVTASRRVGDNVSITAGIEGGQDWIRSSNLGDHAISRGSVYGEWRQEVARSVHVDATLRIDRYSEFGASWSPSIGAGWSPADALRLRASVGRAYRVPTFTERYYSDPANLARPEVGPEFAWAGEAGADVFVGSGWLLQATFFGRADRDVIDWLRPTIADRWRTFNIRDVTTVGAEMGVRKAFPGGGFVQAHYSALDVDAAGVTQLSKYVLDYAPRSFTAAALVLLPARLHVAPRLEYRRRARPSGTVDYVLLDARVGRRLSRGLELFVDGTNIFDVAYEEIAGVRMPGAAMAVGLRVGR